jgi:hypothetical protein
MQCIGENTNAYGIFLGVGGTWRKKLSGIPKRIWAENIKTLLQEIE